MQIIENVDYTHTGWREGEPAWVDAPPVIIRLNRPEIDAEFYTWHEHTQAVAKLRRETVEAYEAALTEDQKHFRAFEAEQKMLAEAAEFYRNRAPGDQRSFWD